MKPFEIFYSIYIDQIKFDSFIGAAGGSKKNSLFYNSENFNVINIGIKATKQITISDGFILPVFASIVFNPRNEIANVVAGISF